MGTFNIIETHTLNEECAAENSNESSSVTRGMVWERAVELELISGRKPHDVPKSDWENTKCEMIRPPQT